MKTGSASKPSLLYVSPVLPSASGSGIGMRSGVVLEALCEHYRVSALVAPMYPSLEGQRFLRERCDDIAILPAGGNGQDAIRLAREAYQNESFDAIHVFRLAGMPFAKPYLRRENECPDLHLDLDDIESKANTRLAGVYRTAGDELMAGRAETQAQRSLMFETAAFQIFRRVYVCSECDKQQLRERCRAEIRVLPNVIRLPEAVRPIRTGATFGFLFMGTLGYYPNKDAVRFFCRQVLPFIRQHAPGPFMVHIAGSGYSEDLRDLNAADVRVIGPVEEVRPWYEQSDAVIVPVQTGGGTRIKILEAFAYRRPVVTTTIGAEGIDAEPNRHFLTADTPEAFAEACVLLMKNSNLARALVEQAYSLVSQRYTVNVLKEVLAPSSMSAPAST